LHNVHWSLEAIPHPLFIHSLSTLSCADDQVIFNDPEELKQAAHNLYNVTLAYGITVSVTEKICMAVKSKECYSKIMSFVMFHKVIW
jgi:hypothetical protein